MRLHNFGNALSMLQSAQTQVPRSLATTPISLFKAPRVFPRFVTIRRRKCSPDGGRRSASGCSISLTSLTRGPTAGCHIPIGRSLDEQVLSGDSDTPPPPPLAGKIRHRRPWRVVHGRHYTGGGGGG